MKKKAKELHPELTKFPELTELELAMAKGGDGEPTTLDPEGESLAALLGTIGCSYNPDDD